MKHLLSLAFGFLSLALHAQTSITGDQKIGFSTNFVRPLAGILDANVYVPVTEKQSIILGVHHYSMFYNHGIQPGAFSSRGTNGEVYSRWTQSNIIAADYRFYGELRERRYAKKLPYISVLNKVAFVQTKSTRDLVSNPDYTEPVTDPLDPEFGDDDWFPEPEFLPNPNGATTASTTVHYRFGLELGKRILSEDASRFREFGYALVFNPTGFWPAWVLLNYRIGF